MPLLTQAARVLEMVARSGSIRRAAERINAAPSAVNRQILNLEAELGTQLFERLPRGMRLTEAGRVVVEQVREWQLGNERTLAAVASLKGYGSAHVRIGVMECLAAEFLPGVFGDLCLKYPGASLHAVVSGTEDIARQLMAGEVDLAVTFNAPRDIGLKIMHEMRLEIGAIMPPDHPLADGREVHVEDLFEHPLIMADNTLTIGPLMDDMLERSHTPTTKTVITNSVTMLKTLVAQGVGVSMLTKIDVFSEVRAGTLCFKPLAGGRMFELLSVAARDFNALQPAARDCARIVASTLEHIK